jgi:hypothetical protein
LENGEVYHILILLSNEKKRHLKSSSLTSLKMEKITFPNPKLNKPYEN